MAEVAVVARGHAEHPQRRSSAQPPQERPIERHHEDRQRGDVEQREAHRPAASSARRSRSDPHPDLTVDCALVKCLSMTYTGHMPTPLALAISRLGDGRRPDDRAVAVAPSARQRRRRRRGLDRRRGRAGRAVRVRWARAGAAAVADRRDDGRVGHAAGVYLLRDRVLGRPEDPRYADLRARGSSAAAAAFFPSSRRRRCWRGPARCRP